MSNQQYEEARKRVKRKKQFYEHLATYIAMSIFFIVLNWITSPWAWWFQWPVLGWGMAVLFNYLDVFGVPGVGPMNKEWEDQAIEDEIRRMDRHARLPLDEPKKEEDKLELKQLEKRKNWDEGDLV